MSTRTPGTRLPVRWTGAVVLALAGTVPAILESSPAGADTGTVTVSAATRSSFSLTLDTTTVTFGTNLGPEAGDSNEANVAAYLDADEGAYYVKNGNTGRAAVAATVRSTGPWGGSVAAAESSGSSGITVAGGALRWKLNDMGSLAAARGGTAFSTAPDDTVFDAASSCASGSARSAGVCTYNFDYSLRVRWVDSPGTFTSVLTYSASQ